MHFSPGWLPTRSEPESLVSLSAHPKETKNSNGYRKKRNQTIFSFLFAFTTFTLAVCRCGLRWCDGNAQWLYRHPVSSRQVSQLIDLFICFLGNSELKKSRKIPVILTIFRFSRHKDCLYTKLLCSIVIIKTKLLVCFLLPVFLPALSCRDSPP